MSKESISHRYDIEYTHPAELEKTSKRSWIGLLFIIITIFIALFLTRIFYKNNHISEYLQGLVTSYTSDDKKDEYNNFYMTNHALPIAMTRAEVEVEEKQNTDKVTDRDNIQSEIINTIKKSNPVDEALSSSITSTKPIVKIVTPKPSLNNTSNLYPSTKAHATKTLSTRVSNTTSPSSNITNNNTPNNTEKDIKTEQDENKTRVENLTKLDDLLNQLSTESTKIKELEDKLKNKKNNNYLSKLLASSLTDYKNNDKQYLSALENLNEAKLISKKQETSCTAVTVKTKKELNTTNNKINLSLKAQVDAIILSLQANK